MTSRQVGLRDVREAWLLQRAPAATIDLPPPVPIDSRYCRCRLDDCDRYASGTML